MSDTSWYQRKLAERRQQAQPQPQARAYPGNGASPTYPQVETRYPQVPGQYGQPQQQYPPQYNQPPLQPQPQQMPGRVTTENLYEAAKFWRGGPGAQANPDPCPSCGGNQYFSNVQTSKRGPQPAAHCYNCGYNDGMFTQGDAAAWGAA